MTTKAQQARIERTAKRIVAEHLSSCVTSLISELVDCDSDLGREIMFGYPESEQRCYDACQVFVVDDWLATRLKKHNHRVIKLGGGENCWARGGAGQAIYMDTVIQDIAAGK